MRAYRNGADPYARGQHRGIDISAPDGASVVAAAAGTRALRGHGGLVRPHGLGAHRRRPLRHLLPAPRLTRGRAWASGSGPGSVLGSGRDQRAALQLGAASPLRRPRGGQPPRLPQPAGPPPAAAPRPSATPGAARGGAGPRSRQDRAGAGRHPRAGPACRSARRRPAGAPARRPPGAPARCPGGRRDRRPRARRRPLPWGRPRRPGQGRPSARRGARRRRLAGPRRGRGACRCLLAGARGPSPARHGGRPRRGLGARVPGPAAGRGLRRGHARRRAGAAPEAARGALAPARAAGQMSRASSIGRRALLRHHADLLRERRAPPRPRLHHGRGRRAGPPHAPARRGRLLPHGHRRARRAGGAGGRARGRDPARAGRPQRRAVQGRSPRA